MIDTRILGDYILIKQVGQGSMGSVFLAEHRFMKKQYILKVLPEELSSDRAFIQRFEEDVALLTSLEHPHIAKIHTVSFAQGQYFLVADCVVDEFGETTNLGQYLLSRGKSFDEETLFRLLRQLAEALDYAHSKKVLGKGIVHRNIKLNNILIAKGRGGIDLKIADFGLTRIVGQGAVLSRCQKAVAESLGLGGLLFGIKGESDRYPNPSIESHKLSPLHTSFLQSFAFLAPEQKRTELSDKIEAKADVYAFGVLAYYLLTTDFPEGIFMPTKIPHDFLWNWDLLINACLQQDAAKRPASLVNIIDAVRQQPKNFVKDNAIERLSEITAPPPIDAAPLFNKAPNEIIEEKIIDEGAYDFSSHYVCQVESAATVLLAPSPTQILRPIIRTAEIERPHVDHDPAAALVVDSTVKQYTPERREIKNLQPILTEMVVIPGGSFYRGSMDGSRDEMPRHRISLSSFAIDIHPVTNEQFVRFLDIMGGEKDTNHQDIIRMRDSRIKRSGGKLSIESGYSKHPVVGVTWYGAVAYAKWIGKRLPTEAEWEVAARAGLDNQLYPFGDDIEKSQANFFSSDTTAVMSYAPNGYGLSDVAGNVYEWCHDWYGYNYYEVSIQEPDSPKGPLQGVYRVLRGGCWKSLKEDLRCSRRHRNNPGTVNGTYGFRCAADVQ